ncbi:MAG: hypothetical protein FJY73_07925 [Candidatus Eisenbacteria bacterium]|nr:hypothetical protein [Candidatus Eisenbacteria bacterium]
MKRRVRIGVLVLLLVLFIPATVFSHSGDGDIPERRTSPFTGGDGPVAVPMEVSDWRLLVGRIVETLFLLF